MIPTPQSLQSKGVRKLRLQGQRKAGQVSCPWFSVMSDLADSNAGVLSLSLTDTHFGVIWVELEIVFSLNIEIIRSMQTDTSQTNLQQCTNYVYCCYEADRLQYIYIY